MPLTLAEKQEYVKLQGFDPQRYTVDDNTVEIVPITAQPTANVSQPLAVSAQPKRYGAGETFARNAVTGLGPAAVGLGVGAKVGAVTAPFMGPYAAIPAIASGIGASALAALGQEKLLGLSDAGRKFSEETAAASAENPVAAVGGNLAAQLPFLRPSPMMIKDLGKAMMGGKGVLDTASQIARSPAGLNIGIGTGIGAGAGLYDEYTDPADFNAARFGLNVLGGAALHQPTRISSRYLGVEPYVTPTAQRAYSGDVQVAPDITASPRNRFVADESGAILDRSRSGVQTAEDVIAATRNPRAEDFQKARVEEVVQAVKENPEAILRAVTGQAAEVPKPLVTTETGREIYADYTGNQEADIAAAQAESADDLAMRRLEGFTRDRYQDAEQNHAVEQAKQAVKQEETQLNYEELKVAKEVNAIRKAKLAAAKARLEAERSAIKAGKEYTGIPEQEGVAQRVAGISLSELNKARAASHPGIDFAYEPGRTITTPEGREVFGYAEGQNKVRATETKPDTVPHEFSHILMDELPAPQRARMQKVLESDPKAQRWIASERAAGREPGNGVVTPEFEYLAQISGETDVKRILNRDDDMAKSLTSWFRSNFTSSKATPEDFARWLTQRFTHSRTSRAAGGNKVVRSAVLQPEKQREADAVTAKSPFQLMREEVIGKDTPQPSREELRQQAESDRQRNLDMRRYRGQDEAQGGTEEGTRLYNELQPKLRAAMSSGGSEFQTLWAENERIKNTYFEGHTPEGYTKRKSEGKALQDAEQKPTSTENLYVEAPRVVSGEKGVQSSEQLWNRVKNKITPLEAQLYEAAGVKEYLANNPRVSGEEMSKWLEANGPKVEVHSYGQEGKVSEAKAEYDNLKHELESASTIARIEAQKIHDFFNMNELEEFQKSAVIKGVSPQEEVKLKRLAALRKETQLEDKSGPRATSAYNQVSPLDTKKHPVVRVDVVVPTTGKGDKNARTKELYNKQEGIKRQPDNLHENLPNTLGWAMMQYVEHPTLGKVALVGEAQSRWGQYVRETIKKSKEDFGLQQGQTDPIIEASEKRMGHPLLKDYNRLILKAAIQQAKKDGATHIAISDSKSALLTEQLDTQYKKYPTQAEAVEAANRMRTATDNYQAVTHGGEWYVTKHEKGFDFAYDNALPQIAKDLTGVSGVKESFGEHKNAFENVPDYVYRREQLAGNNIEAKQARSNLIFRNPDETPKTDITATVFPLEKTPASFTLTRSRYSDVNQSPTESAPTTDPSRRGFLRSLTGQFDQVATVDVPVSEAMKNFETRQDTYVGWGQDAASKLSKFDPDDVNAVVRAMDEGFRSGETSIADTTIPNMKDGTAIANIVKELMFDRFGKERGNLGIKIDGREVGMNELYIPHQFSDATLDLFVNRPTSPEARAAKNTWAQWIVDNSKMSPAEAMKDINDYIKALGGDKNNYQSINFGAIRRAQGFGLPESLRELDAVTNLLKYTKRAAADLAFYGEIESKADIRNKLGLKNPLTGKIDEGVENIDATIPQSPIVRDAMKIILRNLGASSGINPKVNAFARFVNSGILGPATGVRDVAAIPANLLPYVSRLSDFGAAAKGLANFRQESANALLTAAKRPNMDKFVFGDLMDSPDKVTNMFNQGATLLRRFQGREALENFGRDIVFSMGKELARNNIAAARAGDTKAVKWLEKMGRLTKASEEFNTLSGEALEGALNQIAKNLTDRVQGTYGGRGLPTWTMEGGLSPFLSMQKWGIEKSNVIYQDVIKPFITGENRLPLLTYLFGSVLTGAAIQELNKVLTGRKPQDADVKETLSQASVKNVATELATLMQIGSFAGIVSDGLKFVSDVAVKGKTPRNLVSFPAATTVADLGEKVADFSEALQQGTEPWLATKMFALDMFTHNIQAARMLANQTVNADEVERSDKFRDMRVWKELTGAPAGEPTKSNKYLDAEVKEFKKSGDLSEAAGMMPALLEKFGKKVRENPAKAMRFLAGLKANNYQTMPSPDTAPEEFVEFYQFLVDTQGREAAGRRLEDYIRQGAVNRVKASLVP